MSKFQTICLAVIIQLCVDASFIHGQQQWLPRAHAHNDYYHQRPLLDALEQGFTSVEADVFLRNGQLVVAHSFLEIRPERTLKKLYLDPLFERFDKKNNAPNLPKNFLLLIDFKTNGSAALKVLNELLVPYQKNLTRLEKGQVVPGVVTVVISGNRPTQEIASSPSRLVFLDGRLGDSDTWGKKISPLISESWNTHFTYRGFGEMKPTEKQKLTAMVQQVHDRGQRIRFWALPDREKGWSVAFSTGVDLINTDKLEELRKFLLKQEE